MRFAIVQMQVGRVPVKTTWFPINAYRSVSKHISVTNVESIWLLLRSREIKNGKLPIAGEIWPVSPNPAKFSAITCPKMLQATPSQRQKSLVSCILYPTSAAAATSASSKTIRESDKTSYT